MSVKVSVAQFGAGFDGASLREIMRPKVECTDPRIHIVKWNDGTFSITHITGPDDPELIIETGLGRDRLMQLRDLIDEALRHE